jgi:hypothetical protein
LPLASWRRLSQTSELWRSGRMRFGVIDGVRKTGARGGVKAGDGFWGRFKFQVWDRILKRPAL